MKKDTKNAIISGLVAAALVAWAIMASGCSYGVNKRLEQEGHWPGYVLPIYGPHDQAHQIELRNAYSDGWQDRGEANE